MYKILFREILLYQEDIECSSIRQALKAGIDAYNSQDIVLGPEDFSGDAEIQVTDLDTGVCTGWLPIE